MADGPYQLVAEDSPDPADLALLEERVTAAAIEAAGVGEDRAFGIFVRDDEGRIVAGISGMTWGGCCELHAMWVDEPFRGRGLARELMAAAESLARGRGCGLVEFFAYDLLVAGLYERLGYEAVGVIQGCPAGSTARWYRKDLEPQASGSDAPGRGVGVARLQQDKALPADECVRRAGHRLDREAAALDVR